MAQPGYLYVLRHPSDPFLVKVGRTTLAPERRLTQHNRNFNTKAGQVVQETGQDWTLEQFIEVPNASYAEKAFWQAAHPAPFRGKIEVTRMGGSWVEIGLTAAREAGVRPAPKPRDKLVFTTKAMCAMSDDPMMIARAGGATAAVDYLEKARASSNTSKMGSWYPLNCVDTPDQPQTRVPNLAGNDGGKGSEEDGHLYGYDTKYGIGGDSWIHSTSMINVGYYLAVAPNNPSANVRNLPFNT